MAEERAQRRLAAIFVVDVAGSLLRDATVVTPLKTDTFGDFNFFTLTPMDKNMKSK